MRAASDHALALRDDPGPAAGPGPVLDDKEETVRVRAAADPVPAAVRTTGQRATDDDERNGQIEKGWLLLACRDRRNIVHW